MLRWWLNRVRRRLWRLLYFRMLFGERSNEGRRLPHTRIGPSTCIEHEERLALSDHVYIGHFNFIEASHGVTIGEGTQVTSHVIIVSHSSHLSQRLMGRTYADWEATHPPAFVGGPVHIGPYCFIGPHSVIEANTRLGRGCIVAAHSRVRGEFGAFSMLAGSPAVCVGDTRDADAVLLRKHPEWRAHYEAWAGALPLNALRDGG